MTALEVRTAVLFVVTTSTVFGTTDNPVSNTFYWVPDQIPFAATPALVVTSPDDEEHITTLGGNRSEGVLQVDIEYLDAPIQGDDLQIQMASVEAWFEQAKINLRNNPTGQISGDNQWAWLNRMRTRIDRPLIDQGRVFYHGTLTVWVKVNLIATAT